MNKPTKQLAQELGIRTNQRQKGLFDEVKTSKSKPRIIDNTNILRMIKERELTIMDEMSVIWLEQHHEI